MESLLAAAKCCGAQHHCHSDTYLGQHPATQQQQRQQQRRRKISKLCSAGRARRTLTAQSAKCALGCVVAALLATRPAGFAQQQELLNMRRFAQRCDTHLSSGNVRRSVSSRERLITLPALPPGAAASRSSTSPAAAGTPAASQISAAASRPTCSDVSTVQQQQGTAMVSVCHVTVQQ